jgi:hypothetical protein
MKMIVHYIVSTVRHTHAVCGVSYVMHQRSWRKEELETWDLFDSNPSQTDCPYCKATETWKQARLKQLLVEKTNEHLQTGN